MAAVPTASEACHNCRRRRWKCDRTLPFCKKCSDRGQECLGYPGTSQLLIWEQGMASRGRLRNRTTFEQAGEASSSLAMNDPARQTTGSGVPGMLQDPLLQDLPTDSRQYLAYFTDKICKDLVLYDGSEEINHFRQLIPMIQIYPALLQIMLASGANQIYEQQISINTQQNEVQSPIISKHRTSALVAKQKALQLLMSSLNSPSIANLDTSLATVLLFIRLELYNANQKDWMHHIKGARTIVQNLARPNLPNQPEITPLRRTLISNCLILDIASSMMAPSLSRGLYDVVGSSTISSLLQEDSNHCSSFPLALLQLAQAGAQLLGEFDSDLYRNLGSSIAAHEKACKLITAAEKFDPAAWATNIQQSSPTQDIEARTHVATAHRAALCIYLARIHQLIDGDCELPIDLDTLVAEVLDQVAHLTSNDPLYTSISWPAFIAGAETKNPLIQEVVAQTFNKLLEWESWGMLKGALGILERLWTARGRSDTSENPVEDQNWIAELRRTGVDWLVI